jgi:hypothetical protein
MLWSGFVRTWVVVLAIAACGVVADNSHAQPHMVGPQKCVDCHKAENAVWEGSKHATSFKDIHRKPEVKDIIAAAGGNTNMRRNEVCTACHFSNTKANATAAATASAGPSCESCHGNASEWINIHNDYGGAGAKRETETAAHKAERIRKSAAAGMIWPSNLYDVAENCLSCHGLGRADVPADTIAKMVAAGHPAGSNFELVRYSQGTVRHRFYPPDVTRNAQMTPAELSRVFLTGHAAALVQTSAATGKSSDPKLQKTLDDIKAAARTAIDSVKGQVPEAAALLARPSEENAKKFVAALAAKDLSTQVGSRLPAPSTYK